MLWLNLEDDESVYGLLVLATREELVAMREELRAAVEAVKGGAVVTRTLRFPGIPAGYKSKEMTFVVHPYGEGGHDDGGFPGLTPRLVQLLREEDDF